MEDSRRESRANILTAKGRQLELFADSERRNLPDRDGGNAKRIARYLASRCNHPVDVVLTDNTSTMITVARSSTYRVRLHHMFADAPPAVLNALAVYLKWPRHRASNITLRLYMKEKSHLVKTPRLKDREIRTRGEYFDLKAVYERLNRDYFGNELSTPITWGRPFRGRRRRSINFGSVNHNDSIIRINPSLDAPFVPEFFLEYIVFHEMLHCQIDTRTSNDGRTLAHHRDFRQREQEFPRYRDALKWQEENLHRFLRKRGR